MSLAVLAILLVGAAVVTVLYGSSRAFVWVYLPSFMFLFRTIERPLPFIPGIDQNTACIYGMCIGVILRGGESLKFRFNNIDVAVLAMSAAKIMTTVMTLRWWTGMNTGADELFRWVMPYLFARQMFADVNARRFGFEALGVCTVVVAAIALVEVRLLPFVYSRTLESLGVIRSQNSFVYHRWGFSRAMMGFSHPIDFGNVGVLAAALLLILGVTSGRPLNDMRIRLYVLAGLGMAAMSLSFTSHAELAFAVAAALCLWHSPTSRKLLVPGVFAAIAAVGLMTAVMLTVNLEAWQVEDFTLDASLRQRTKIVQETWPAVSGAGIFGHGRGNVAGLVEADSIDNSYMLFLLRFGWAYLAMWLWFAVAWCRRASAALSMATAPMHRAPLIAAVCGVSATLLGMNTVFFDTRVAYALLFPIVVGVSNSMFQIFAQRREQTDLASARGFAVGPIPTLRGV